MTTKTVLVAGASGVFGREVRRVLTAAGYQVLGLGRGADNEVRADLLDRAALLAAVRGVRADVVVHAATALKKPPTSHKGMYPTDELRIAGTANLLAATEILGAQRFVGENIAFGYGYHDHGEHVLTEDDPFGQPDPDPDFERHMAGEREKELLPLAVPGLAAVSLRYGLFYGGPATDTVVAMLRKRQLPTFDDHGRVLPWTHITDAAGAVVAAIERGRPGAAYNVADESQLGFGGMVREVARAFGTPTPLRIPVWLLRLAPYMHRVTTISLRVSSQRARDELGWQPQYPTIAAGLSADAGARR
jgi:nucleoside-diphosphate-sugar epimerase